MRFTQQFNLVQSQWELDFIDIPLESDIELYIDPYAITIEGTDFSKLCDNMITTYFQLIIESIKKGNKERVTYLLNNLHEPNDIHLGLSKNKSKGKGVGANKANHLADALMSTQAAKTGLLRDLSDCSLIIPGIGRDNISDITANIIRERLIEFTQEQCELYNIPMRKIQAGLIFNFETETWNNKYIELPHHNGSRILLVPKTFVRYSPSINAKDYYNDFVLDFLRAEHLTAGDSMVKTLKNKKEVVLKKDLKVRYPNSKEFLLDFSIKNSNIYDDYRNSVRTKPRRVLADEEIESKQEDSISMNFDKLMTDLVKIKTGKAPHSEIYHSHIFKILNILFSPNLKSPKKEERINEGRKRIDISYTNTTNPGFFNDLIAIHRIRAPYIHIECKNYSNDVANPELDQIRGRFSETKGMFGIITCRSIEDKIKLLKKTKDIMNDNAGYVIVLSDEDIINLLKGRQKLGIGAVNEYLSQHLKELLL